MKGICLICVVDLNSNQSFFFHFPCFLPLCLVIRLFTIVPYYLIFLSSHLVVCHCVLLFCLPILPYYLRLVVLPYCSPSCLTTLPCCFALLLTITPCCSPSCLATCQPCCSLHLATHYDALLLTMLCCSPSRLVIRHRTLLLVTP